MADMWGLIAKAAIDNNVQVFATTHSKDCVESLVEVSKWEEYSSSMALHRLEQGRELAVSFDAKEMQQAIKHDFEVR